MSAWIEHVERWKDCTDCPLCQQRDRICLARGNVPCDVLFIGEAPGASEDVLGQPFVGPAGKLMDQIIEQALPPIVRYVLTNLVACYPAEAKAAGINEPEHGEILACRNRLVEFVNIARPRLIVCVGALSALYVDHNSTVRCVDIIHPASTMGDRMPLTKKRMAINKAIVVLRCAVEEEVLQSGKYNFTKWGTDDAYLNAQVNATYNPADVPF